MKKYGFSRKERLHLKKEFSNIIENGIKLENEALKLYYLDNTLGFSRLGIILNRKFGKSVERNRAKRILRELFRLNKYNFVKNIDMIFYIKSEFKNLTEEEKKKFFLIYY